MDLIKSSTSQLIPCFSTSIGGRRCTAFGCSKGARDKLFCAGHGGGRRCAEPDCQKSAVGGSLVCCTHGGGRKCSVPDCTKSRQSPTQFCIKHGGGRICSITGCTKVSYCYTFDTYCFNPCIMIILSLFASCTHFH